MSFVAGRNLAQTQVIPFDLGGTWQNFASGIFRPDGSAEGYWVGLRVAPGTLKLNPATLRQEATGTMVLVRISDGAMLVLNEAAVSVLPAATASTNPQYAQVPGDIRASGLDVNGNPWSVVSVGGEVQGQIGGVDVYVVHCEIALTVV